MKTLVIQGVTKNNVHGLPFFIPSESFGYVAIESVDYLNWYGRSKDYAYVLTDNRTFRSGGAGAQEGIDYNYLGYSYVPVGSLEFVTDWLHLMGVDKVEPLNIPQSLWSFVRRDVDVNIQGMRSGKWFIKSCTTLKDMRNDVYESDGLGVFGVEKVFMTRYIEDVISEWRVFVFNGRVVGIKCYSGDEWTLPDKSYIEQIVQSYNKRCYTLDVMTYKASELSGVCIPSESIVTDIVELHDFFSCGLYGFDDYRYLAKMWSVTISELLSGVK